MPFRALEELTKGYSMKRHLGIAIVLTLAAAPLAQAELRATEIQDVENLCLRGLTPIPVSWDEETGAQIYALQSVDEFGNAQSAYLISQQELNSMPVCVAAPADFASEGGEYQTASFTANAGV